MTASEDDCNSLCSQDALADDVGGFSGLKRCMEFTREIFTSIEHTTRWSRLDPCIRDWMADQCRNSFT